MWEAYGLENEDLLWASAALGGGLGGYRKAVCGALSSSAVCLGFRHKIARDNEEAVEQATETARDKAKQIAENFQEKFGNIICEKLADFGDPDAGPPDKELRNRTIDQVCIPIVLFCIEKLYELDEG